MKHFIFAVSLLMALVFQSLAQVQGPAFRSNNGIGTNSTFRGPVSVVNYINATNAAQTNTIAGYIQQGGTARASYSAAFGLLTDASATAAFVTGIRNQSFSPAALVGGTSNTVFSGANNSLLGGAFNTASGQSIFAVGTDNDVQGNNSAAIGSGMVFDASAHNSIGFGTRINFLTSPSNSIAISAGTNGVNVTRSNSIILNSTGGTYISGSPIFGNGSGLSNIGSASINLGTFNVIDYLASPSLSDNSLSFSNTITAASANGGTVVIPTGTYKFTLPMVLKNITNVTFQGYGIGQSVLQSAMPNTNMQFWTLTPGTIASNVWWRDLSFRGATDAPSNSCHDLLFLGDNVVASGAERCEFANAQHAGFRTSPSSNSIARIKVLECVFHDILTTNSLTQSGGAIMISKVADAVVLGCDFYNLGATNLTHAIYPLSCSGLEINGCSFRGQWVDISMGEGNSSARIENNSFFGQDNGAIDLNGTNVLVFGNSFNQPLGVCVKIGGEQGAMIQGNTFTLDNGTVVCIDAPVEHVMPSVIGNTVYFTGAYPVTGYLVRSSVSGVSNLVVKGNTSYNYPIAHFLNGWQPICENNVLFASTMTGVYVIRMQVKGTIRNNDFFASSDADLSNSYLAADAGDEVLATGNIIHNGPIGATQSADVANLGSLWQNSPNAPLPTVISNSVAPYLFGPQLRFDYNYGTTNGRIAFRLDGSEMNLVSTGGVSRIIVTNGFVGINTTNPSAKLSVAGTETTDPSRVNIAPAANQNRVLTITESSIVQNRPSGGTDGSIFFDGLNGRVGIRTAAPGAGLSVKGVGTTSSTLNFQSVNSSDTQLFTILNSGEVGIGVAAPTNKLQVIGAIQSTTTVFSDIGYHTNGVLWQGGAQLTNIYTATATLDFGNVATIGCADLTITVTGAALGDVVDLGVPDASAVANSSYSAWVSAANTVTVRFCALISGDPASGVFRAEVHKWK